MARPNAGAAPALTAGARASWSRSLLQLALAGVVLAAATAGGAVLLAIAENGNASLETLVLDVAIPAAGLIVLVAAASRLLGLRSLTRAILLGLLFGTLSTAALELVRNIGFYQFQAMPGQLPELMGVLITNRIMFGPDLASNLVGWLDHIWNGALFGVTFVLLVGGSPRGRSHWYGVGLGVVFGLVLGTGFLLSPVSRATGAGIFGSVLGAKYVVTVYLAHAAFGAALGWLTHRFGGELAPVTELLERVLARPLRAARAARLRLSPVLHSRS